MACLFDRLRRKLFNEHRLDPDMKVKRDFDDPKYRWRYNRVRLTKKQGALQAVYGSRPADTPNEFWKRWLTRGQERALKKWISRPLTSAFWFDQCYSSEQFSQSIAKTKANAGQLGMLWINQPRHAIAVHKHEIGRVEIFDPNFGEYGFADSNGAGRFIFDLCGGYRRYGDFTGISFRPVTWRGQDEFENWDQAVML